MINHRIACQIVFLIYHSPVIIGQITQWNAAHEITPVASAPHRLNRISGCSFICHLINRAVTAAPIIALTTKQNIQVAIAVPADTLCFIFDLLIRRRDGSRAAVNDCLCPSLVGPGGFYFPTSSGQICPTSFGS